MNTSLKFFISLFCVTLIVTSCSRKKDTFINRNFHALGTKYNILYNGNIALEKGRETVDNAATDNYWELLPIERMQLSEEIVLPGQSKNQDFERAEEKAIKAVQKHGMNIKGKEYNPQIDEAYLLLGQARYFDQRFVPALEAFNYILYKYPASDKINTAKVWREKANIRLENNQLAIKNLKRLLDQEELEDQDLADATSMLAQAYINIKSKDSALVELATAAEFTKKNKEKARFNYIIGQLYNEFGEKDSANIAFDKVIDMHRKIPRPYYINAHLAKSYNFDMETGNQTEFLDYLTDLEEDRENRPFLDKIYYRIAEFHRANKSDSLAVAYYNKSLRTNLGDKELMSRDYATLGDMSFDEAKYKRAGAYYDSTMTNMKLNSRPYRIIKRKRENLEDVIYYEDIAQANDSILRLVNMSDDERLAYFTDYTNKQKAIAEAEKEKAEIAERLKSANSGLATNNNSVNKSGKSVRVDPTASKGQKQEFYFYNSTTVAFGKNEFVKIWGDRALKDNWRLSDSKSRPGGAAAGTNDIVASASENEKFDPEFYISKIPTDQKVIDSLAKDRNYAYYQLGVIYKEKFKEYELAMNKLETLLQNNPEDRLILPSKYNLQKIYTELGLSSKANAMKSDIVSNYPDSRYAKILLNPRSEFAKDENSPESLYEGLFKKFGDQEYAEVISQSEKYITEFEGDPMVPKFEILKASANGRLHGFEAYKNGVNFIALTYPNSDEGKQAQEIMKSVIPILAKKEFVSNDATKHFNVLYPFNNDEKDQIKDFVEQLNDAISKVNYFELSTSIDIYDANTVFVVVHGLTSIQGAAGFAEILEESKNKIDRNFYSISSPNYEIVQRHKNLNEYLESQ
ncbi:tetratricopeptide repeat protein [uncultured Psychroserpens sp.]|uniref:type IX secretion system periplasmic lipoprotein PorW/SprE n=1 Tax=uncultured Psychroserpens sp. TaxID=255436 RepID=UPI00261E081F|nr:tetratricopeptide repeat protein [uncultured Psychroserpens sp.]